MGKWVNFVNVISSEIIDGLLFLRLCSFLATESKVLKCIDHEFHKFWQITRIFDDKTGDFMLNSKAMFWTWLVRFSMFFHVRSDLLEKTPCMFYTAFWTELTSSVNSNIRQAFVTSKERICNVLIWFAQKGHNLLFLSFSFTFTGFFKRQASIETKVDNLKFYYWKMNKEYFSTVV